MAVRTHAQLVAAKNALLADGQADGSITAARFRAFEQDVFDTLADPATIAGWVTAAQMVLLLSGLSGNDRLSFRHLQVPPESVSEDMLGDDIVGRDQMKDNAVGGDVLEDGGIRAGKIHNDAGPDIRSALSALSGQNRLGAGSIKDLATTDILTATDGNGNIPASVTTLQELLTALDGLAIGGGGGLTSQQVTALIRTTVAAMLTGNTETGIVVTYETSDNTIDFVVSGGTAPTAPATRYWGWSTDTTFAAAEFTSAATSGGVVIPNQADATGYLALAVPSTEDDITRVTEANDGGDNIRNSFLPSVASGDPLPTITLGGTPHKYIYSETAQFGNTIGDTWDWS